MKGAHIGRALAKETQRHVVLAAILGRKGDTGRDGHMAADNGVAAHEALGHIKIVHGAAPALGTPGGFAEQLGHGRLHVADPGQIVAVLAVGGHNVIGRLGGRHGTDGNRLLAHVQVQKAAHLAPRV